MIGVECRILIFSTHLFIFYAMYSGNRGKRGRGQGRGRGKVAPLSEILSNPFIEYKILNYLIKKTPNFMY